ncbi:MULTISPECIES: citrate/2-methylcitrate synthase [Marinobacter]|jgi:citrate synthase|uniref:citrate/2-methylcitrate synthase n=1 Tax=Marinobacter TaxID=2742 RepID=UPI0012553814|nr:MULTISPECIES: citrate/2-methylcitrate synthase [Marinobacter]MBJ7301246.1 citrate/2-methylcitrate synthase [Marinobacter salarius]MDC8457270.1 citrate/2-methylcitrate synthase [Marinobacter sp. DS40M6]VVT19401.1 Citrate synthase 1 [Marinobacter salarius]VXB89249.1 Citrate synthase 1 [Marinobacter salarius]HIO31416.1 citrate/2-methylcitrate synthase [Marinobacter salarius]|tara:strand:- start:19460 stop:20554 length:1095 start_codon:yes stop_codon:yes gene_type:complete
MNAINEGLEGIAIGKSKITYIDGLKGQLIFRGHWVEELATKHSFEEVAYLLLFGELPTPMDLAAFSKSMADARELPQWIYPMLDLIPDEVSYMAALRTAMSTMPLEKEHFPPEKEEAIRLIARAPVILAYLFNKRMGQPFVGPDPSLGHVDNYLYMLSGERPAAEKVKLLETYLVLSMDHSINASTFTARVVTSTEADLTSSIVAAISALLGPLHGGAPSKVDTLLDEIGSVENAEAVIRNKVERGERIMGFGHRVYKTHDPRGAALRSMCEKYKACDPLLQLGLEVEQVIVDTLQELKPGRDLYPNLEFWAAAALRVSGLQKDMYTPTFCLGRIVGWSAHIAEQAGKNRLIRPTVVYSGTFPE